MGSITNPCGMNSAANAMPMIAGVEITTDEAGRFNLNALHKASGGEKKNGPSYWLALDTTKSLIDALGHKLGDTEIPVSVIKGGLSQGTFAHELLAISYAGWISPAFQLQVNQVFLDYRTGKLQPVASVDPIAVLNDPAAMRGLLLTYSEKVLALEEKVEEAKPVIAAFERIAVADGSMNMTEAAKALQVQPSKLKAALIAGRWIYKRAGARNWLGYQDKIQQGLVEHKINTFPKPDGSEGMSEQVRITAKGLTKLARQLSVGGVQ